MKKYILYLGALVSAASLSFADLANDSASNYSSATFTSGANEGSGFGAWTLASNNGGSYVEELVMGDPAFGLWANWGGNSSATRALASELVAGETISLTSDIQITWTVKLVYLFLMAIVLYLILKYLILAGQWKIWDGGVDFNAGQGWQANYPLSFSFTYNGTVDGQESYDWSW